MKKRSIGICLILLFVLIAKSGRGEETGRDIWRAFQEQEAVVARMLDGMAVTRRVFCLQDRILVEMEVCIHVKGNLRQIVRIVGKKPGSANHVVQSKVIKEVTTEPVFIGTSGLCHGMGNRNNGKKRIRFLRSLTLQQEICDVVMVEDDSGSSCMFWIARRDHILLKRVLTDQNQTIVSVFSDFRQDRKVRYPARCAVYRNGQLMGKSVLISLSPSAAPFGMTP